MEPNCTVDRIDRREPACGASRTLVLSRLFLSLLLAICLAACASAATDGNATSNNGEALGAESPRSEGSEEPETADDEAPGSEATGESVPPTEDEYPDDGFEWSYDSERDHFYRIEKVEKIEGTYSWIDDKTIRVTYGIALEVVDHDDDHFWIKIWRPRSLPERTAPVTPPPRTPAEEAELSAAVAASYATDWKSSDRHRFEPMSEGLPSRGQWRNDFDLADMDGDGRLDIVFGPARKARPEPNIFLHSDDGTWRRWSEAAFGDRPLDYGGAAAGDLNGDGRLDLALGIHLRGVTAFVRGEGESFEPWDDGIEWDHPGRGGDASSFSSRRLEILDWDGDGDGDLLVLGEGPKGQSGMRGAKMLGASRGFVLYENLGDGSWAPHRIGPELHFGDKFVLADVDGDGVDDLVVAARVAGLQEIVFLREGGTDVSLVSVPDLRPNAFLSSVAAEDLDADGATDLVVAYLVSEGGQWWTGIDLFYGDGGSSWERSTLFAEPGRRDIPSVAVGDFDADGRRDVVGLTGEGGALMFLGQGRRSFVVEKVEEMPGGEPGCAGRSVAVADLDGDGLDDVVAAFAGEPAGVQGIRGMFHDGCEGEGRLQAWRSVAP